MPFINKVTVRGTTYYLENLTDGSNIAKLPTAAQGLRATDTIVTEGTLGKFTVTPSQLEEFKTQVETNFSDLEQDFSGKFNTLETDLTGQMNTFQTNINEDLTEFKAEVDKLVRYELPVATADTLGGVQPIAKTDDMTYEVGVDAEGKLWVVSDLEESKEYTNSLAYSVEIVDVLPTIEDAEERTFYLIPKASGKGYEKYWKITDADGNSQLDEFAGSSTEIITSIEEVLEPDEDVDYLVYDGNVCLYYKWISGNWCMVAGSVAVVVDTLEGQVGNAYTDYYVKSGEIYFHYRWDTEAAKFVMVGSDSYNKTEIDNKFTDVSNVFATKEELNVAQEIAVGNAEKIEDVKTDIKAINKTISEMKGDNENLIVQYDEVGSVLHLYERDENGDITITDGDQKIKVKEIYSTIIVGGGGGDALISTIKLGLNVDGDKDLKVLYGNPVSLNYILSTRKAQTIQDETGKEITIYEEAVIPGDITITLYKDNIYQTHFTIKKTEPTAQKGSIDVTEYVSLGSQVLTLKATYVEQLGSGEETITVRAGADWSVEAVNLKLIDLPDNQWETTPKTSSTTFYCTPVGDLEKTIYFQIDDAEPETKVTKFNGTPIPYTIRMQSHGVHTLRIWCTGEIGGKTISTDVYTYVLMFKESGNNTPIIRIKAPGTLEQYSAANIYYNIVDPLNEVIDEVTICDETGTVLSSVANITSAEQTYEFKPTVAKTTTITVKYKDQSESVSIEVTEFPYEISAVTKDLMLDFVPTGRTNSDVDYNVFKNNAYTTEIDDETGEEIQTEIPMTWTFSDNFDWINGGWQRDEAGDTYFCVKAGTSVAFNYKLFENANTVAQKDAYGNYSIPGIGKEFKIIFKTTNVARSDAEWLSCYGPTEDGYNAGIRMEVHNGYVSSNIGTLEIPYSEEDIIEFDTNIVPISEFSPTYEPQFTSKNIPMVLTYEDGTPVQPMVITSASTSFQQENAVPITIGSDYCDVHIYRMKVYNRYLTDKEILNNFIADARSGVTMAERYVRNDIYTVDGQLDPETLAKKCPDLFVYVLSAPKFTNDKKDKVANTTIRQYKYDAKTGSWPIKYNWTATGATHNGQGTSSNEYGYASRNLEFNMKKATITLGDNSTVVKKIQLSDTSVPTNYLNLKVNVASSEHCNNALLQKRYDRYLPYTTLAAEKDDRVKNSMEFFNCVVFIQETGDETHREFSDKNVHFYSIGNIGDSKKTDSSRTNDPDDVNEFCVEVMDWNRDLSEFPMETRLLAARSIGYEKVEAENVTADDLVNYYERVELPEGTSYVKTEDVEINPLTTYYIQKETFKYNALLKPENCGENGIIYEMNSDGKLVHSMDITEMDFSKDYYVDILEGDDFSEDYTYGFRYIQNEWDEDDSPDYKELNEAFQKPLRQKWIEFYRFVTRDLTTGGKEDKEKVAAWKKEFEDWFILDSALYYYLYTLRYTMVDNRAKNSFYHYGKCPDGKYRYEFWAYDMDTALGIDNAGKLDIPFGQEDHDVDNAGAAYFRAHNSLFFDRIVKYFSEELNARWAAIEQNPIGNAFDSVSLLNEFDAWQKQFAEELWRLDYERKYKRTYVGGNGPDWDNALPKKNEAGANITEPRFLKEMMNGRKKYQRRQFERAQDTYMSSKFLGSKNVADTITLRGAGASETHTIPADYTLSVVPFANMYINIHDGTTNFYHNRCYAGQTYNIDLLGASGAFDFGYIRGSSNIQELGDLSLKYLQTATLNSGSRLKTIKLGNADERYENKSLKTLAIGSSNRLLEELDIRNLKYLANESLDLPVTNIPSLKRVYAQGSNIRQARFANNGLLEEAYLPGTVTELSLRNLHFIKTIELESYDNLVNLTVENCPTMNNKVLTMIGQAKNLKSVRVTNINWEQKTTDLLNRIVKMKGSLLSGFVKLTGYVRQSELDAYAAAWPDLNVDINEATLVPQYPVRFLNYDRTPVLDKNGDPYVQLVDEFKSPYDPTEKDPNTPIDIDVPVREETAQYKYVFTGWSGINGTVPELTEVIAMYIEQDQYYDVYWHNKNGDILYTAKDVKYGDSAVYEGSWPTYTVNETEYYEYSIFTGWDISTSFIVGETHAYAQYETVNGLPAKGTDMKDMTVAQIYSIVTSGNNNDYFEDKDYIDIQLGNDYSYSNVTENIIIDSDTILDGSESKIVESDIKLCGSDSPAFTIAIDFEFGANDTTSPVRPTLVSCFENANSKGLRLFYGTDGNPAVQWGDQTMTVGYGTQRNMVVIRHAKGAESVHVYAFNGVGAGAGAYSADIDHKALTRTTQQFTDRPIIIGGFRYDPEAGADVGKLGGLCNGTVHWVKVWNEDLGDADARSLAAWTHETVRFQYCGSGRYQVNPNTGRMTGASFICENLLSYGYSINTSQSNVGGWEASLMRGFCNDRVYNAFPAVWKSVIKKPYIPANIGNNSSTIVTSQDYIYLPSYVELAAITSDPYNNEGYAISWMTSTTDRIKKQNGVAVKYWTRSAMKGYDRYWVYIAEDGSVNGNLSYAYPQTKNGICPCFSI